MKSVNRVRPAIFAILETRDLTADLVRTHGSRNEWEIAKIAGLTPVCGFTLMAIGPPLIVLASAIGIAAGVSANLWPLFIPAVLSWLLQDLVLAMVSIRSEVSPAYALTAPLSLGLLYAMLFDSSIRITRGKGVTWKGRRIYERGGVSPPRFRTEPHVSSIDE